MKSILQTIAENQLFNQLKISIDIDRMPVKNELKERVLMALQNDEDFALKTDSGNYCYFINKQFMITKMHDNKGNSITHLPDLSALQNALKMALLGHNEFIEQRNLLFIPDYKLLKEPAK